MPETGVMCRGSLGFGEDNVRSLPGNVGTNDVADCIKALDDAIALGLTPLPFASSVVQLGPGDSLRPAASLLSLACLTTQDPAHRTASVPPAMLSC